MRSFGHQMPVGKFEMAPLSEFTVTKKVAISHLPQVKFMDWYHAQRDVSYELDWDNNLILVSVPHPLDVAPTLELSDTGRGWKLKWKDEE